MPNLLKPDSTFLTLVLAVVLAIGLTAGVRYLPDYLKQFDVVRNLTSDTADAGKPTSIGKDETAAQPQSTWAASAAGRVEPKGGTVHVRPEASGTVIEVVAAVRDKVLRGDILALLDDVDVRPKLESARAEVAVRLGERDDDEGGDKPKEKNSLLVERRAADDAVAAAERSLHKVQLEFDRLYLAARKGKASDVELERARKAITTMKQFVASEKAARVKVLAKPSMPKPTRLDSGLAIARSELRAAELAFERTRVRATAAGTILSVDIVAGEVASPNSAQPLATIGNLAQLEVRAEVDERDVSKVSVGQDVVVRSNAFPGRDFTGKVEVIEPALGSPALKARGPRKPSDVDVLDVKIALDSNALLMPGMRVDVFFKQKQPLKAAAN
jgi:HlyD family secretion protein